MSRSFGPVFFACSSGSSVSGSRRSEGRVTASPLRKASAALRIEHLANAIDLQSQAKQAHWNIKGPNFVGLHDLFDRMAAQAGECSDLIAERAVALGGVASGTVQVVSSRTELHEYPLEPGDWRAHVHAMQDALPMFGRGARRAIDEATGMSDAGTADLFTEISRAADKSLWMVEAHIQDTSGDGIRTQEPKSVREASRR